MQINHSSLVVEGVFNELKHFLECLKGCDCLRKCRIVSELNSQKLYRNVPSSVCTNKDLNTTYTAFKRLVDNLVIMEESLKKSINASSLGIIHENPVAMNSGDSKTFIHNADVHARMKDTQNSVINDTPSLRAKTKNVCKHCRKRFATKEILNYHMTHLHKNTIPE